MFECACAAAGDDRDTDGFANAASDHEIESCFCAIGVDAVQHDLTGTEGDCPFRPLDSVETRGLATAVREYLPLVGSSLASVDGDNDALAAKLFSASLDQVWLAKS